MVAPDGTHTYQYDDLYRLTQVTYPGPVTDTYTSVGNRLTKNSTNYTYAAADQMTDAGGTSYGYDANGNQTSRGSDTFSFGHENRMPQAVSGSDTSSFTYNGDGLRMSQTSGGSTTASYTYDVFGATSSVTGSGSTEWLFTGEQRDSPTSLYYLRARYYDPETGRFLSRDPFPGIVGAPQTQNPYAYAENSPTNLIDPDGQ